MTNRPSTPKRSSLSNCDIMLSPPPLKRTRLHEPERVEEGQSTPLPSCLMFPDLDEPRPVTPALSLQSRSRLRFPLFPSLQTSTPLKRKSLQFDEDEIEVTAVNLKLVDSPRIKRRRTSLTNCAPNSLSLLELSRYVGYA